MDFQSSVFLIKDCVHVVQHSVLEEWKRLHLKRAFINLSAIAYDDGGAVSKVEFFANQTLIGEDNLMTANQYQMLWLSVAEGTYNLVAKVTDNEGNFVSSNSVSVTVSNDVESDLKLTILSPADGAGVTSDSVLVEGTFEAPVNSGIRVNGEVASIYGNKFYANGV